MTTNIVQSISDEALESIIQYTERKDKADNSATVIDFGELRGLIARLRAAEVDAKRYRWLRNPSTDPASVIDKRVGDSVTGFGIWEYKAGDELDDAIDEAMERKI